MILVAAGAEDFDHLEDFSSGGDFRSSSQSDIQPRH